jgi:DNA-binding response OmpR family regulator
MRILLIEDDARLRTNLSTLLSREHYAVDAVDRGDVGIEKAMSEEYDCLLVDWMLPDLRGCR